MDIKLAASVMFCSFLPEFNPERDFPRAFRLLPAGYGAGVHEMAAPSGRRAWSFAKLNIYIRSGWSQGNDPDASLLVNFSRKVAVALTPCFGITPISMSTALSLLQTTQP